MLSLLSANSRSASSAIPFSSGMREIFDSLRFRLIATTFPEKASFVSVRSSTSSALASLFSSAFSSVSHCVSLRYSLSNDFSVSASPVSISSSAPFGSSVKISLIGFAFSHNVLKTSSLEIAFSAVFSAFPSDSTTKSVPSLTHELNASISALSLRSVSASTLFLLSPEFSILPTFSRHALIVPLFFLRLSLTVSVRLSSVSIRSISSSSDSTSLYVNQTIPFVRFIALLKNQIRHNIFSSASMCGSSPSLAHRFRRFMLCISLSSSSAFLKERLSNIMSVSAFA